MKRLLLNSATVLVLLPACSCRNTDSVIAVATEGFVRQSGEYEVNTVVRFSDCDTEINDAWHADLTNNNGYIAIADRNQPEYPIIGKVSANKFSAHLNDAGGSVSFIGRLIGDNEIQGQLQGTSEDSKRSVEGSFRITMETSDSHP